MGGANLPPGPWDQEPDREHWIDDATGLDGLIVRNAAGALCGYVGVPAGHPWHGKDFMDLGVYVHGGLTYSGPCDEGGKICHAPHEAANADVWWLGFDCCHGGDLIPAMQRFGGLGGAGVYRDFDYVRGQVRALARQVQVVIEAKSALDLKGKA